MRTKISQYDLGEITAAYLTDEYGKVELLLFPTAMEDKVIWEKRGKADSMIQLMLEGDAASGGFAAGHTERNGSSVDQLCYKEQRCLKDENAITIETYFYQESGLEAEHRLIYENGESAVKSSTKVINRGTKEITLTMLSSFSLGMITPFCISQAEDQLRYHRIRSKWSAEGKVESGSIEDLQLEPSWSGHGVAVEKYGETGSLPVRKFFPFAAVEDTENRVVWAASLACASSWQMELYRRDESLCVSGGIADFETGHWKKRLAPGEAFEAPTAYLTVSPEGFDHACQNLTAIQDKTKLFTGKGKRLPVIFNEFCSSWGKPDRESIAGAAAALAGKDFDYFIIDAGWYADKEYGWENNMGDWEVSEELFPNGLEECVKEIKKAGLKPGIWFEIETVGKQAKALRYEDCLLKREGKIIRSGDRFFWDMRKEHTKEYLRSKVIKFLNRYGFEYVKIDYNESIGIGCDGAESLGQGLYENMLAAKEFFREIKHEVPGICMEICSSGGHRSEPSFLDLADMISFSDAHEEPEIPVIAGNMHRVMRPEKCQIWCVVRAGDSLQRICYSMTAAFPGVLCVSGDIFRLDDKQWEMIESGIAFYRRLHTVQINGTTSIYGTAQGGYRRLKGWQGILRQGKDSDLSYLVLHSFEAGQEIRFPMEGNYTAEAVYEAESHDFRFENGEFVVKMHGQYDAMAVLWKKSV